MAQLAIGEALSFATVGEWLDTAELKRALTQATDDLRVDLSATQQVDSAGVALLLRWLRQCQQKNLRLVLVGASAQLHALLEVCDLKGVFQFE